MPIGELLNLRWSDVDLDRDELTVRRSATKERGRTLPLTDDARKVLEDHRSVCLDGGVRQENGYVFTNGGPKLKPQRVRTEWW